METNSFIVEDLIETANVVDMPETLTFLDVTDVNLVVTNATAPDTSNAGEYVEISWTVENQGLDATNNTWFDLVYFSVDETFDFSDISLTHAFSLSYDYSLEEGESYTVTQNVYLPYEALGDGYLLFVTDEYNDQAETDETDNTVVRPITITPPDVNLVVTNIDVPDTANVGEYVEISWTVENQGLEATYGTWYDQVFFSVDETFNYYDYEIYLTGIWSGDYDDSLAEGESYTVTQNVYLPYEALGDGYLLFVTDAYNVQAETDEADNVVAQEITITPPDINLVITNATAPDTAIAGEIVEISWTVENQGLEATNNSWGDTVYFSVDETLDFSDTYITSSANLDSLAGGESYTVTQNVDLPAQAVGDGYLLFVTDSVNAQAETDETDNVVAQEITITTPDVNLVVTNATAPDTANIGETVEISWTVENQGLDATNNTWFDLVYFSVDETFDFSDAYLTYAFSGDYDDSLEEGESYTVTQNVYLPYEALGDGYLLFVTDAYNAQPETDETDNTVVRPITITTSDVNLVVTNATAPDTANIGESVEISWTVENQGLDTTYNTWSDYVYFSVDETLDFSDTYITSSPNLDSLAGGESYTVTQNVDLPYEVGSGYLLFVTDRFNFQAETDETDNVLAVAITLTTPPITGTNNPDSLIGTTDDDTIIGLLGADVLTGNGGQDTFVYSSNRERIDTITDFGLDDRLDFSTIFNNPNYSQSDRFASYVNLIQVGANTEVQINPVGDSSSIFRNLVTLENVSATDLSATNFIV